MNRNMIVFAAIGLAGFGALGAGVYIERNKAASKPSTSLCTPASDERCPTDQFVTDYRNLINLQKEVADMANAPEFKKVQEKSDQLTGMSQRLGTQVPAGFQWDASKMKFTAVKQQPPTPPANTPPPGTTTTPTIQPKEKK